MPPCDFWGWVKKGLQSPPGALRTCVLEKVGVERWDTTCCGWKSMHLAKELDGSGEHLSGDMTLHHQVSILGIFRLTNQAPPEWHLLKSYNCTDTRAHKQNQLHMQVYECENIYKSKGKGREHWDLGERRKKFHLLLYTILRSFNFLLFFNFFIVSIITLCLNTLSYCSKKNHTHAPIVATYSPKFKSAKKSPWISPLEDKEC